MKSPQSYEIRLIPPKKPLLIFKVHWIGKPHPHNDDGCPLCKVGMKPKVILLKAPDYFALLTYLNQTCGNLNVFKGNNYYLLHLECSCKKKYIYKTVDDIPSESVQCDCGVSVIDYDKSYDSVEVTILQKGW